MFLCLQATLSCYYNYTTKSTPFKFFFLEFENNYFLPFVNGNCTQDFKLCTTHFVCICQIPMHILRKAFIWRGMYGVPIVFFGNASLHLWPFGLTQTKDGPYQLYALQKLFNILHLKPVVDYQLLSL